LISLCTTGSGRGGLQAKGFVMAYEVQCVMNCSAAPASMFDADRAVTQISQLAGVTFVSTFPALELQMLLSNLTGAGLYRIGN
jgi:hypothetical protein